MFGRAVLVGSAVVAVPTGGAMQNQYQGRLVAAGKAQKQNGKHKGMCTEQFSIAG